MPRKKREINDALLSKGFEKRQGSKHELYIYVFEEKKTAIGTKLSRGSMNMDINDNLLYGFIKMQLKVTNRQLDDLIDCPMSAQDYEKHLRMRGLI